VKEQNKKNLKHIHNVQNMYCLKLVLVGTHLVKVEGVSGMLHLNHVGTQRAKVECLICNKS